MKAKRFINTYAKKAKTVSEKAYWGEAAHFAGKLLYLAKMAQAYHNGEKFDGITGQPVANEILRVVMRLNDAENAALAVLWCRGQEAKELEELKRGQHLRTKRERKG